MAGIRAEDGIEGHGRHQSVKETLSIAGIEELAADEASSLALACLQNRWLIRGIQPTDPNTPLSEQFSFFNSDSLESLCEYFRSGSHRIREGIVFGRLAFVQQVNLGDEWLVLRRMFDEESGDSFWQPFESYSLSRIMESQARFGCAIKSLEDADPFDTAVLLGSPSLQSRYRRER